MPFFDDSGPRVEEERTPLERAFALLRDQLERFVTLNLLWALQALPLLLAWAFELPDVLRAIFTFYSILALPVITAALFAVMARTSAGEPIDRPLVLECLHEQVRNGLLKLLPLYSVFLWGFVFANLAAERGWILADALAQLALMLLALSSLYWGPLLADQPALPVWRVPLAAARLTGQHPGQTLLLAVFGVAALVLGVISIAGLLLIVPVLLILLQTEFYRFLTRAIVVAPRRGRQKESS